MFKNETYKDYTVEQIDAKLERDLKEHRIKTIKYAVAVIIFLMILFRGTVSYWVKFGLAFPFKYENTKVETKNPPIQENYTTAEQEQKTFTYKSLINGHKIKIIPKAYYKLSGLVIAYNHDFFFRSDFFDSAALYDLGVSWGKMGNKKFFKKNFKSYSQKNEMSGSRVLWVEPRSFDIPIKMDYAKSHYSHSHLVPANNNIMGALLKIKDWDLVEIEGELIDMEYINKKGESEIYKTSMSRTDGGWSGDRGNGSCETVYVTRVKRNNAVYR